MTRTKLAKGIAISLARMKEKKKLVKVIFFSVLSVAFTSCGDWEGGNWNQTPELPVITIKRGNYSSVNAYSTRLEGVQDIEIKARIDGYVQEVLVDEGDFVKKGQPLFRLEANVLTQNTAAANAAIASFEASVHAAQIEVDRLKPLVNRKIVSEVQLETAEAKLQLAKAQFNQAISNHAANLANQDYMNITSPVDGYVGKINFREGSLVGPGIVSPLTTISNTREVYAYFSMSELEIAVMTQGLPGKNMNEKIRKLPPLKLRLSTGEEYPLAGKIEVSTGKISTKTGAIQLRVLFDNPEGKLLSGNTGMIYIPKQFTNRIAIPDASTMNMQGMKMVYVISEGDTLRMRPVEIEAQAGKYLIVNEGVNEGEQILAQGVGKVYPNSVIVPFEVEMDSLVNSFNPLFK